VEFADKAVAPSALAASTRDVRLDQAAARDWSDTAGSAWRDAEGIWRHLSQNTNHPHAALQVDWGALCPPGASVLDLGCGSGWLTAIITRRPEVTHVVAWDSSPRLLGDVLPQMMSLLDGDSTKLESVCGEFTPLLLEDSSLDLVVMGSAFHHCAEPEVLLGEVRRVLRPGRPLLLLNETPWRELAMLWFDLRLGVAHLAQLLTGRGPQCPGQLADDHVLYDPILGDRAYTMRGWRSLMRRTGWRLEVLQTGLTSYPASFRRASPFEPLLTHFLLRPT
jgi:SAM-dependent methyltransferase